MLVQSHQAEIIIVKRLIQGKRLILGCGLNPDYLISVVVKTTLLPVRPRCRLYPFGHAADSPKSHGHNHISPCFLQVASSILAPVLYYFIDNAFEFGINPQSCKIAKIVPLYKVEKQTV